MIDIELGTKIMGSKLIEIIEPAFKEYCSKGMLKGSDGKVYKGHSYSLNAEAKPVLIINEKGVEEKIVSKTYFLSRYTPTCFLSFTIPLEEECTKLAMGIFYDYKELTTENYNRFSDFLKDIKEIAGAIGFAMHNYKKTTSENLHLGEIEKSERIY